MSARRERGSVGPGSRIRRRFGRGAVGALAAALATGATILAPHAALACAVCTSGRDDETNAAFLVSTIFLSLLPLGALGGLVFYLWRRFQQLEQASASARSGLASEPAGVEAGAGTPVRSPAR